MAVATLTATQSAKRVGETLDYSVDFTNRLTGGKTVSSGSVSVYDRAGVDHTGTILSGSVTDSSPNVSFTLTAGVAGGVYDIIVSATLNTSEIVQHRIELAVYGP